MGFFQKKSAKKSFELELPEAFERLDELQDVLIGLFVALSNNQLDMAGYEGYYAEVTKSLGVQDGAQENAVASVLEADTADVEKSVENVEIDVEKSAENVETVETVESSEVEDDFDADFGDTTPVEDAVGEADGTVAEPDEIPDETGEVPDETGEVADETDTVADEISDETTEGIEDEIPESKKPIDVSFPDKEGVEEIVVTSVADAFDDEAEDESTGANNATADDEDDFFNEKPEVTEAEDEVVDETAEVADETSEVADETSEVADETPAVVDETADTDFDDFFGEDEEASSEGVSNEELEEAGYVPVETSEATDEELEERGYVPAEAPVTDEELEERGYVPAEAPEIVEVSDEELAEGAFVPVETAEETAIVDETDEEPIVVETEDELATVGEQGVPGNTSDEYNIFSDEVADETDEAVILDETELEPTATPEDKVQEAMPEYGEVEDKTEPKDTTSAMINKNAIHSGKEVKNMASPTTMSELVASRTNEEVAAVAPKCINPTYSNIDAMSGEDLKEFLKTLGLYGAINKLVADKACNLADVFKATAELYRIAEPYDEQQALVAARLDAQGIDISQYLSAKYSPCQMRIIGNALLEGAEISAICDPELSPAQMMKLLELQKKGIPIEDIANPKITVAVMDTFVKGYKLGVNMTPIIEATIKQSLTWKDTDLLIDLMFTSGKDDPSQWLAADYDTTLRANEYAYMRMDADGLDYQISEDGTELVEVPSKEKKEMAYV